MQSQISSGAHALQLLRARAEIEAATDIYGATLRRRIIFPRPVFQTVGEALPDEVVMLRGLLAGGDLAEIAGPLEFFLLATGPVGLTLAEAIREAGI